MYEGGAGILRHLWPLEVGFSDRSRELKPCTNKYEREFNPLKANCIGGADKDLR